MPDFCVVDKAKKSAGDHFVLRVIGVLVMTQSRQEIIEVWFASNRLT